MIDLVVRAIMKYVSSSRALKKHIDIADILGHKCRYRVERHRYRQSDIQPSLIAAVSNAYV